MASDEGREVDPADALEDEIDYQSRWDDEHNSDYPIAKANRRSAKKCQHVWVEYNKDNDRCAVCRFYRLRAWESQDEYDERKRREAMASDERRSWHVEVRQERDATDMDDYFDCWNVYLVQEGESDIYVCRCLEPNWADRIMRALNHDLAND